LVNSVLTISTNYTRFIKLLKNIPHVSYELTFLEVPLCDLTDYGIPAENTRGDLTGYILSV